jgi:pantoate--beta-alanine ligase
MEILEKIADIQHFIKNNSKKTVGFVPTMGALHEGHLRLIDRAKKENDLAVCSIFVNPTQFNNPEDLAKYPRTLEQDCEMLDARKCDIVFAPSPAEMYSEWPKMRFDFGNLETIMEGKFRPGHFNGVGIVVSKLFNIVKPTKAYFGQKDIQQVAVINRMVKDLSYDVEVVVCDTIRTNTGLAMSSRNKRLSDNALAEASKIYESLNFGKKLHLEHENSESIKKEINLFSNSNFTLEYFEITDFETLEAIEQRNPHRKSALIIASFLDGVRLIDNIVF